MRNLTCKEGKALYKEEIYSTISFRMIFLIVVHSSSDLCLTDYVRKHKELSFSYTIVESKCMTIAHLKNG